jgi:hypothetical protein
VLRRRRHGGRVDGANDEPLRLYQQLRRQGRPTYSATQCEHLREHPFHDYGNPDYCEDHTEADGPIVHLRVCLTCGHVACCDSSQPRHATRHFEQTGHPVMQSAELGETWRWCYLDEQLG